MNNTAATQTISKETLAYARSCGDSAFRMGMDPCEDDPRILGMYLGLPDERKAEILLAWTDGWLFACDAGLPWGPMVLAA